MNHASDALAKKKMRPYRRQVKRRRLYDWSDFALELIHKLTHKG